MRIKDMALWKLAAIFNHGRHFDWYKKLFFYELWPANGLTQNKREDEKMFDFEEDMNKKPILGSHFEFGRHFEIKQDSTQVKMDFW